MADTAIYANFGPRAQQFDEVLNDEWRIIAQSWKSLLLVFGDQLPSFETALDLVFSLSPHLFCQFEPMSGSFDERQRSALWGAFRCIFNPSLGHWGDLASQFDNSTVAQVLAAACKTSFDDYALMERINAMKRICYAPFRDDEIQWLLAKHRRIVEVGGGGFYFADHFRKQGGDVVSIDNDAYGYLTAGAMHSWTLDFIRTSQMVVGGVEQLKRYADGRALLIAAPQPGSSVPGDAIKLYRQLGGQVVLLKLGGYVGQPPDDIGDTSTPPERHANIFALFQELASHWRQLQDPTAPPYLSRCHKLEFARLRVCLEPPLRCRSDSMPGRRPRRLSGHPSIQNLRQQQYLNHPCSVARGVDTDCNATNKEPR